MTITVSFPTVIHVAADDTRVSCSCPGPGTGSFCGTDGECHFYSCRDYLAYGQDNYYFASSTNDATSPPELVCSSYSPTTTYDDYNGVIDGYNGVIYGCSYTNLITDPNFAVKMPFNEKCSAQINERVTFDCWQFAEGTKFDSFLSEAGNATICTEDDDLSPSFFYRYPDWRLTHRGFVEDWAIKTAMYSLLTIEEATNDTLAPTPLIDEYMPAISSASSARYNWMASSSLLLSVMKISDILFI